MPGETQNGTAIVFGITNSGTPITIEGYATFILETGKAQHKFKVDYIEDENGFDTAAVATNAFTEVDLTWTPSGASKAAAAATAVFLEPLSKVTLANFTVTEFNGDWLYIGDASIDLSHKQAKMMIKVRKYADSDQNSSMTTTVS